MLPPLVDPHTLADLIEDPSLRLFEATVQELRAAGVLDAPEAIAYRGGGIAATVDLFALTLLGHPGVRLYDGSLNQWSDDPDLPLETG